jgi:putative heme-binding domain-containing protein
VDVELAHGIHRLLAEIASTPSATELQFHFRRKSSTLEHERLVQSALARPGNPERGRKVLEDVEKSLCLKCHRLGDRGERIGPELTKLGGRFSRITIIESILEPSRSIAPSFEQVSAALADGRVITGVRVAETEQDLTLGDQEGRKQTIRKANIESMKQQSQSLMPEGLEKRLTSDEFVDLIGYLTSQK